MNDSGNSILDEGDILEADICRGMGNKKSLTKITECSCRIWVAGSKAKMS
jgi:hypothetical protein